jgi:hypothetical protein
MNDNQTDTGGAIDAISNALVSMEARQTAITGLLAEAKRQRREVFDAQVKHLLPDLSGATQVRLNKELPGFGMDPKVRQAFDKNKKTLGLFKPTGYDQSLAVLQMQLIKFLEGAGVVAEIDQESQKFESEKNTLSAQQSQALEMLGLLEKAHRLDVPLPATAVASINVIAQKGRDARIMGAGVNNRPPPLPVSRALGSSPASTSSDDGDLWLWMMTDIPTSFRTLMLETFTHHDSSPASGLTSGGGDFSGAGASQSFGDLNTQIPDDQPTASGAQPIATDDRLGAFS